MEIGLFSSIFSSNRVIKSASAFFVFLSYILYRFLTPGVVILSTFSDTFIFGIIFPFSSMATNL